MPLLGERPYDTVPVAEGYDRWSVVYDDGDNALLALEEPVVDALLGEVGGLRILDVGCGTGRHAIRLAARGARVTGVDFSAGMLAKARAKAGADRVSWREHDLARPLPFDDGAFDRVLCALVLEHVGDLEGVFRQLRRVCRAGGAAVITCMHPAMMLHGVLAHFDDPATGREVQPESHVHETADFVNAALGAGWILGRMEERSVDTALLEAFPRMHRHRGWPLLLAMHYLAPGPPAGAAERQSPP